MAKRVRAARHYQRKDTPIRLIAQHGKPGLRKDFREAFGHLGTLVNVDKVKHFARAGDWHNLKRAINWGHYREVLKAPFNRIIEMRHAGAKLGALKINGTFAQARRRVRFRKDIGDRFNFDLLDQATQDRIRQAQDELIQQLEMDARDTIDTVVYNAVQEGLGPDEIVSEIRNMIGLTDTQAQAVMNYQRMLYDLDPTALQRQLRNTGYDAAVQDAIDSGVDLADAAVEQMVGDYISNYLDYRAETIAQTESVRAANEGLHDAYSQAVDRGAIPGDAITRNWQVALDEKTCEICLSVVDQNPDGVGIDETFDSIDGPQDDPPAHPNCRCSVEYITNLDMVPED